MNNGSAQLTATDSPSTGVVSPDVETIGADDTGADRSGGGFTVVADQDANLLRRLFPDHYPTLHALWYVLIREARFCRSNKFRLTDGILADRASVSRMTVSRMKPNLKKSGLVSFRSLFNSEKRQCAPTEWTVKPSVPVVFERATLSYTNVQHEVTPTCNTDTHIEKLQSPTGTRGLIKPPSHKKTVANGCALPGNALEGVPASAPSSWDSWTRKPGVPE